MKLEKAANRTLAEGTAALPDVGFGIDHLLQPTRIAIIQTELVNGYSQEIPVYFNAQVARQPMPEELAIKMLGERSWRWHILHIKADVRLRTDDRVVIFGTKYRIMNKRDYSQYGFVEYQAIEDYQ